MVFPPDEMLQKSSPLSVGIKKLQFVFSWLFVGLIITFYSQKSSIYWFLPFFFNFWHNFIPNFMSTHPLDIDRSLPFSHDIWCRIVTNVYISRRVMFPSPFFGCPGIMAKSVPVFGRTFLFLTQGIFPESHWLSEKFMIFFLWLKAVMKTCVSGKIPREDAILVQGIRTPAGNDTTSEPPVGNVRTGAPVKASMSDGTMP